MHECFERIEKEIEWTKRNANHNDNQQLEEEEEEEEDEEEEERAEAVAAQREKVNIINTYCYLLWRTGGTSYSDK